MSSYSEKDFEFMAIALDEAKKAYTLDEVPVGAVIVKENMVIARAHNLVETEKKATCHAEMLAIEQATQKLGDWRLVDCVMYCTLEPCIMCAGALILSRIKQVFWGTKDFRHGANGSITNIFETKHPIHQVNVQGGLLAEDSMKLLQDFFREKRKIEPRSV